MENIDLENFNSGLIVQPPEIQDWSEDQAFGSLSGISYEIVNPSGDWTSYFPKGEKQRFRNFESMACASYTANDCVETQVNKLLKTGQIYPDLIRDWIDENGDFNLSDRFTAKMSGTTANGNSLAGPAESIRKNGACPESMWPGSDNFNWNQYYCAIPQDVKNKGLKLLDFFDFSYEYIATKYDFVSKSTKGMTLVAKDTVLYHLKQAPLSIATACCPGWFLGTEKVDMCYMAPCHATCIGYASGANPTWDKAYEKILDHYDPYVKTLAGNYLIYYGLKLVVKPKDIIKKKIMLTPKIVKDKNSAAVGLLIWPEPKSSTGLETLLAQYNKSLIKKADGSIDWKASYEAYADIIK